MDRALIAEVGGDAEDGRRDVSLPLCGTRHALSPRRGVRQCAEAALAYVPVHFVVVSLDGPIGDRDSWSVPCGGALGQGARVSPSHSLSWAWLWAAMVDEA